MQHGTGFTEITPTAEIATDRHGNRAKCLQRLVRLELPVPQTVALPFDTVRAIAEGRMPDLDALLALFGPDPVLSVRASPERPDWGGPATILNIGLNDLTHERLAARLGQEAADTLYLRFIRAYAVHVARLEEELFGDPELGVEAARRVYEAEMDEPFPQEVGTQLENVLRFMARAWEGTSARLLRQAQGAPADAGLGLVVQRMALGIGEGESGAGVIQFVSSETGQPGIYGRYLSQSQGRDALSGREGTLFLTRDPRGPSLEELAPEAFAELVRFGQLARRGLREEMQIEFTLEAGRPWVIDAVAAPRSTRAAVEIAVRLAEEGVIPREEALMRISPRALPEVLHPRIREETPRTVLARGVAASPGAATGRLCFSAIAAQQLAAQGEDAILVRRETGPEDIRGMHAARGVLTERGGMTSHAAVIARGLGLPCVTGAGIRVDRRRKVVIAGERVLQEGDLVTVDGSRGELLLGAVPKEEPALGGAFARLMEWAAEFSGLEVRANADTLEEARMARVFGADGIGLCRTEHMFFHADRLTVMREMIFADRPEDRRAALERLLPMQRADFIELFRIMDGRPVTIRLFDPPLHEFLPHTREGMRELAEALGVGLADVQARVEQLTEFNPMLGLRGVRLGVTMPEIYEMQARAIFEAAVAVAAEGLRVQPEVMIPLVSAAREVELVRAAIEAVAAEVRTRSGRNLTVPVGVMVETPRAALRAGDIARVTDFFSFGTNDLTQMTYGLSRDDAGRFMSAYVAAGVFSEDPFHTLDTEGVGELIRMACERGRATRPDLHLAICGEHAGNPESLAFFVALGLDTVSCSPYRVPVARLAAARHAIRERAAAAGDPGARRALKRWGREA